MYFKFKNSYLLDSYVISGPLEGDGPINAYFDRITRFKEKSFNQNEIISLKVAIDSLLEKNEMSYKEIDLALSGDLSNQLAVSSYTYRNIYLPLIGVYSACATFALEVILGSLFLDSNKLKTILITTSSNTQNAERQFRYPNEYGGTKEITQTHTVTIASALLLSKAISKIRITEGVVGKVIDIGFTNPLDFGRCMAPAALEVLFEYFSKTKKTPKDFDLILTGDLSKYGYEIVKKELEKEFKYSDNYNDCGLMIYDIEHQHVNAGGSGPGCSSGVVLSYVKKEMLKGKLKKVLVVSTGALLNPNIVLENESIPSIAHLFVMESVLWFIYMHFY